MAVMLEARQLGTTIRGRKVLNDVTFSFQKGYTYGIIGPNGVGKSTLLKLLSGVLPPSQGDIFLEGRSISSYSRKEAARKLAVLQQGVLPPVGFTVREVIEMGRFPYQNWFGNEASDSAPIINQAIAAMGLEKLEQRKMAELSGGERQRVALAKVMVQQAEVILLDEPTTYLDIGYQIQLLDTVKSWQREQGITVVTVLHDLNLAALYCDEVLVLHKGSIAALGKPQHIYTTELIREVYGAEASIMNHPLTGAPQILLAPNVRINNGELE